MNKRSVVVNSCAEVNTPIWQRFQEPHATADASHPDPHGRSPALHQSLLWSERSPARCSGPLPVSPPAPAPTPPDAPPQRPPAARRPVGTAAHVAIATRTAAVRKPRWAPTGRQQQQQPASATRPWRPRSHSLHGQSASRGLSLRQRGRSRTSCREDPSRPGQPLGSPRTGRSRKRTSIPTAPAATGCRRNAEAGLASAPPCRWRKALPDRSCRPVSALVGDGLRFLLLPVFLSAPQHPFFSLFGLLVGCEPMRSRRR